MAQLKPSSAEVLANTTLAAGVDETVTYFTTSPSPPFDVPKIIALTVTLAGSVVVTLVGYFLWRQFCRSVRPRHGVEKHEHGHLNENKKRGDHYDQFNVDDHQLTVNSVTAILWDEEDPRMRNNHRLESNNKQENSSPQHREVKSGKRTFSVDKVPENLKITPTQHGPRIIKVPKNVAKSLTCGDSSQYTLAIIDKNSKTIHNIDMREYRLMRGGVPVKSGSNGKLHHSHHHNSHHRNSKAARSHYPHQAGEYMHDEPDSGIERSGRFTITHSADETELTSSTDASVTTKSSKFETDELSSSEKIPLHPENTITTEDGICTQVQDYDHTDKLLT